MIFLTVKIVVIMEISGNLFGYDFSAEHVKMMISDSRYIGFVISL